MSLRNQEIEARIRLYHECPNPGGAMRRVLVLVGFALFGCALSSAERTFTPAQRSWWSLQPVANPSVPAVANRAWVRTPVDRFVVAQLEAKQLSPNPPADRRTLLRRVTIDLT